MKTPLAHISLNLLLSSASMLFFVQAIQSIAVATPQEQKKSKSESKAGSAMTGCVDEQDGQYVLIDDRNRAPLANLVADGFPQEGFAKHVGHKVTVHGVSTPSDSRPTLKVRSIDTVSDTCAPQQPDR